MYIIYWIKSMKLFAWNLFIIEKEEEHHWSTDFIYLFPLFIFSASSAVAHIARVYSEAHCRIPKPKIIPVRFEPSKSYSPHCTILHRCSNDTGCCHTDALICDAKKTNSVELYFYVSFLVVLYLKFINFNYFFFALFIHISD